MRSMIPHRSIKTRFAIRFLQALKKLNKNRTSTSTSMRGTSRRYLMVKTAAYESMASAVGSKRAWSRAMLWKIRNRGLSRSLVLKRSKTRALKKKTIKENPSKEGFGSEEANGLRNLVPGGEVMDFCSLLDETAHYIMCLTSQRKTYTISWSHGPSGQQQVSSKEIEAVTV